VGRSGQHGCPIKRHRIKGASAGHYCPGLGSVGSARPAVRSRNKPSWAKDACWEANGTKHEETFTLTGPSVCNTLFPINSTVRLEAGSPLASSILKCQLKPVGQEQYAVSFSAAERARLESIFPQGVCDWSKPGVMEKPIAGTWNEY